MNDALLQVNAVDAGYGRGAVLQDFTLQVRPGATVAIIGPNGAGKTTLMRCVSGVVRPTCGAITLDGRRIDRLGSDRVARAGIAHVPQGRHLFGPLTVRENLRLGGHSVRKDVDLDARIEELCRSFPVVGERLEVAAHTLSGGQQQMVAIARGLMPDPKLLLLDEPSVGLAPAIIDDVAALIAQFKAQGRTVLLSEQNVPLALALADEVYVIAQGAVVAHGAPEEVRGREEIRRAFLGRGRETERSA